MDNTIIQQGRFESNGSNKILSLRSDVDWIRVYNMTEMALTNDRGVEWLWMREFDSIGSNAIFWSKSGGGNALEVDVLAVTGFNLIDSSVSVPGAAVATTAGTNVVQPVISTGSTTGLSTGSIVRLMNTQNWSYLGGVDIEIDTVVANTSFRFRWPLSQAAGTIQGTGQYRIIPFDPIYYPRRRNIVSISQAAQAVVVFSVTHGYTVGQSVRFNVPSQFGMVQIDGLVGTITAVSTAANSITVDINTTAFTAFATPLSAAQNELTWAHVVPLGMDTAEALSSSVDILADATENMAILGIELVAGNNLPGGNNNDEIVWQAGKSFAADLTI